MGVETINYFNIADLIEQYPSVHRFYVVGKRGAGKSYSIKKVILQDVVIRGAKFLLVKQTTPDITAQKMNRIFVDVENDPEIEFDKLGYGDFERYHIMYKAGVFWLVGETPDGALDWLCEVGYVVALSMATRFKGGVYNDIKNIFYDEFISESYASFDEVVAFNKILLTVSRSVNTDVKVFFAGNPDAGIERSAFLQPLKLDYAHLQNYTPYLYDTKVGGKTYANNILFIKLAGKSDDEYINLSAIDISNNEIDMSLTGEVKTNHYFNISRADRNALYYEFELIVETPIVTNSEYNKKIYAYIGEYLKQPCLCIYKNRLKQPPRERLFCRYVAHDIRPRPEYQTYRLNIPTRYAEYKPILQDAIQTGFIITDDDATATLFMDILNNG